MCGINMIIFNNKKGIIFTLLAILLSVMFVLIMTAGTSNRLDSNVELSKIRASVLTAYYDSFKGYTNYVIEISAESCLKSITKYLINNSLYYTTKEDFFSDLTYCMNTSNITKLVSEVHLSSSENLTIPKLFNLMINLSEEEYGVTTTYEILDNNISDTVLGIPLVNELLITTTIHLNIKDDNTIFSPEEYTKKVYIDLENIYDPYYSNEYETRIIENITVIGENDLDLHKLTFQEFLDNVDYIHYYKGIPIINRIINDSVEGDNGVICFLNSSVNLEDSISYVDIYYINGTTFNCNQLYCYKPHGSCENDFKIDYNTYASMKTRYELNTSDWETIC